MLSLGCAALGNWHVSDLLYQRGPPLINFQKSSSKACRLKCGMEFTTQSLKMPVEWFDPSLFHPDEPESTIPRPLYLDLKTSSETSKHRDEHEEQMSKVFSRSIFNLQVDCNDKLDQLRLPSALVPFDTLEGSSSYPSTSRSKLHLLLQFMHQSQYIRARTDHRPLDVSYDVVE